MSRVLPRVAPLVLLLAANPGLGAPGPGPQDALAPGAATRPAAPEQAVEPGQEIAPSALSLAAVKAKALGAMVRCQGPNYDEYGLLLGDRRQVLARATVTFTGRPLRVTLWGDAQRSVLSQRVERSAPLGPAAAVFWVHLRADLAGEPLEPSPDEPQLGEEVYLLLQARSPHQAPDLLRTRVTAAGDGSFNVGITRSALALDLQGRLLGVSSGGGGYVTLRRLKAKAAPTPRTVVLPLFGVRLGYQHGGLLGQAFLFSVEGGVSLWDRLGMALRLGFAASGAEAVSLPAPQGLGPGVASGNGLTFELGLEARYRQLLSRYTAAYLELAVGMHLSSGGPNVQGLAFFSTDPACHPQQRSCPLVIRDGESVSGGLGATALGPSFGADLRLGLLTFGYRFTPRVLSYQMPNAHSITLGVVGL